MSFYTTISQKYNSFENKLKFDLELGNPANPGPIKCIFNLEILSREIWIRPVLLTSRIVKTVFHASNCLLSPVSGVFPDHFSSSALAWERFCKEARHLAADAFELIGVVVCSILLLPFNRENAKGLLNVQMWIERAAESISGERAILDSIQMILDPAKEKKRTLLNIRNTLGPTEQEINAWVEKAVDFDEIVENMDICKKRRISRRYAPLPPKEKLDQKLGEIAAFVSDRIATVAIPKQKNTLLKLRKLVGQGEHDLICQKCEESDPIDAKLSFSKQLQDEIYQTIIQLQKQHDPDSKIQIAIEKLYKERGEAFSTEFKDVLAFGRGLLGYYQALNDCFFFVDKKLVEIEHLRSYRHVTEDNEPFSETFFSDLIQQIDECKKILINARLNWEGKIPVTLDRPRAFKILNLSEEASSSEIKKAYFKLCLIHHPDKGGKEEIFKVINEAYKLLINNDD